MTRMARRLNIFFRSLAFLRRGRRRALSVPIANDTHASQEDRSQHGREHAKCERRPLRRMVRLQLCRAARVLVQIRRCRVVDGARGVLQHAVMHDRRDREPERRAELRKRLEQPTCDALLAGPGDARDEERARGEDKVRAEHGADGCGEAVRPVWRARDDEGEEKASEGGEKGSEYYV